MFVGRHFFLVACIIFSPFLFPILGWEVDVGMVTGYNPQMVKEGKGKGEREENERISKTTYKTQRVSFFHFGDCTPNKYLLRQGHMRVI